MSFAAFRICVCVCLVSLVVGCGTRGPEVRSASARVPIGETTPRFAAGPIATACTVHNRRAASAQRCGCVQAAANLTLSQSEQLRAVRFFSEPELLQQVKLSDTPPDEAFWQNWARFAETAETLCAET